MSACTPANRASADGLRVAVLAAGLRVGGGLSVGLNMLRAFGRVAPQHEYFCVTPRGLEYPEAVASLPRHVLLDHEHRGLLRRWWFETVEVQRRLAAFRPDAVIALGGRGLLRPGCVQCAFPQDPHFYYSSRHFGPELPRTRLRKWYHKRHFARQLRQTQLVLVQTPIVAERLRRTFGYAGQVIVCGSSVTPQLRTGRQNRPLPEALRPTEGRRRLLYLTRYYAHKNLEGALELFRRYGNELQDYVLITTVAADQHPRARAFLAAIERHGLTRRIVNVGPVPHDQVAAYYEHCDALFMPTLLETFGLPYLEAMCFQLPVLTSDLDFAHAVCGDAAIFFDPWNPRSMVDAIRRLERPEERARVVAAGQQRLSSSVPSWDDIAAELMARLAALVRGGARGDV